MNQMLLTIQNILEKKNFKRLKWKAGKYNFISDVKNNINFLRESVSSSGRLGVHLHYVIIIIYIYY